jgi:hypothetical protein
MSKDETKRFLDHVKIAIEQALGIKLKEKTSGKKAK